MVCLVLFRNHIFYKNVENVQIIIVPIIKLIQAKNILLAYSNSCKKQIAFSSIWHTICL